MLIAYLAIALLCLATVYSAIVSFREKNERAKPAWLFPTGARRSARIAAMIFTPVFLIALVAWLGGGTRDSQQRSVRFLIPEGYSGWVRIDFGVAGAAPLLVESGQTVVRIPPEGKVKTASPEQYGWANDSYYFYSSMGLRPMSDSGPQRMIWGKINGEKSSGTGKQEYEEFFVGTEQEYRIQIGEPQR